MTDKRIDHRLGGAAAVALLVSWAVVGFAFATQPETSPPFAVFQGTAPIVACLTGASIVLFELLHRSFADALPEGFRQSSMQRNLWTALVLYSLGFGALIGFFF